MIDIQLCDIFVLPRIILKINTKMSQKKDQRDYKSSISLSQIVELASLGILPVTSGTDGNTTYLRTIGQTGALELLIKETSEESR